MLFYIAKCDTSCSRDSTEGVWPVCAAVVGEYETKEATYGCRFPSDRHAP